MKMEMEMDKIINSLSAAVGRVSNSLDNTNLPVWAKIVGLALVVGLTILFTVDVMSLCYEFYKNGIANYAGGKLVIDTFFNGAVLAAIYASLKLLIDKNKSGISDVLENEDKEK